MKESLHERIYRICESLKNKISQLKEVGKQYAKDENWINAYKCDIKAQQLSIVLEELTKEIK